MEGNLFKRAQFVERKCNKLGVMAFHQDFFEDNQFEKEVFRAEILQERIAQVEAEVVKRGAAQHFELLVAHIVHHYDISAVSGGCCAEQKYGVFHVITGPEPEYIGFKERVVHVSAGQAGIAQQLVEGHELVFHGLQRCLLVGEVVPGQPGIGAQVEVFYIPDAQLVVEAMIAGYHVSGIEPIHAEVPAELNFFQHGIEAKGVCAVGRMIKTKDACAAGFAKVEKAARHELFAVAHRHLHGSVEVLVSAIEQGIPEGRGEDAWKGLAVQLVEFFLFVGDEGRSDRGLEMGAVASDNFPQAFAELITLEGEPHP